MSAETEITKTHRAASSRLLAIADVLGNAGADDEPDMLREMARAIRDPGYRSTRIEASVFDDLARAVVEPSAAECARDGETP